MGFLVRTSCGSLPRSASTTRRESSNSSGKQGSRGPGSLVFRQALLEVFESLVRAGALADPQEIKEAESEEMVLLA